MLNRDNVKMDYRIAAFVKSGIIEGLSVGAPLPSKRKNCLSSTDMHPNGKSRLYQCTKKKLTMNIGASEDDRITYIVIHIDKQDGANSLTLSGEILEWRELTLDQLIRFLEENDLSWKFSSIWERVVILSLEASPIEFVFSFFPVEVGLQIIQAVEKTGAGLRNGE